MSGAVREEDLYVTRIIVDDVDLHLEGDLAVVVGVVATPAPVGDKNQPPVEVTWRPRGQSCGRGRRWWYHWNQKLIEM